jgi:PKD repeat protein
MKKLIFYSCLLLISISASAQVPSYVPTRGLLAYYPFNGNANDVSGNGNNGTINGATLTNDKLGNANSAFSFDGINDFISAPAQNFPTSNNSRSVSLWFKVNNIPAQGTSFMLLNYGVLSSNQACGLAVGNNGVIFVSWLTQNDLLGLTSISINQWYNLTATFDGTNSKLYLNSILINSAAQSKNTNPSSLSIGYNGVNQFTNGILDDIGIWDRALTQTEISSIYTQVPYPVLPIVIRSLGSAHNALSQVGPNKTRVSYAPGINTVLFIHKGRNAVTGSSNIYTMYDISTNGGSSWTNDLGPIINTSNALPQGYIMNPANNTSITNARIVAAAPYFNGSTYVIKSGIVTTSSTGRKESVVSDSAKTPNSFVERIPGEYWMVNDTNKDGRITLYKGVYSLTADSIIWSVAFKLPKSRTLFDRTLDGNVHYVNPMVAFSPNGQIGWIATNGEIAGGPVDSTLYPIFWNTTNGGQTWSGPQVVRLKNLSNVVASVNSSRPSATVDNDLVVDKNGNPHFTFVVAPSYDFYLYDNPLGIKYPIFDITKVNNVWKAVRVDTVSSVNGISFGTLTHGNEIQLSRTKDGSKIFYSWTDTNNPMWGSNDLPNLFIKGYDIDGDFFGAKISPTIGNLIEDLAFLPNTSDIVSDLSSSGYKMHTVIGTTINFNETFPLWFSYLDSLYYSLKFNITNNITSNQLLCPGGTPSILNGNIITAISLTPTYKWIKSIVNSTSNYTDAGGINNTVNYQPSPIYQNTWYKRIVYIGNNSDTSDAVLIEVASTTNTKFSVLEPNQCLNNNHFVFEDSTTIVGTGSINYSWRFGDGTYSNLKNPTKKYNSSGTYNVMLFTYVSPNCIDSFFNTVTVYDKQNSIIKVSNLTQCLNVNSFDFIDDSRVSAGSIASRIWDFGDGTTSTSINPIKKYNSIGNYNVKLKTFTNNGCVDSTLTQVSVIKSPQAGNIAGTNTNVMPNTQYLYNINQQLNHTYEWQIENGAIISGQGTNAINIQWLNNGAGVLRCIITSTNNCTDTAKLQLNVGPTGINDIKNSNIKIYPNPTNNIINIEGLNKNENNTIQIFDVQGKLVITKNITEKGTIDLSELNKGVYVIKIGEVAQRIVKI